MLVSLDLSLDFQFLFAPCLLWLGKTFTLPLFLEVEYILYLGVMLYTSPSYDSITLLIFQGSGLMERKSCSLDTMKIQKFLPYS